MAEILIPLHFELETNTFKQKILKPQLNLKGNILSFYCRFKSIAYMYTFNFFFMEVYMYMYGLVSMK